MKKFSILIMAMILLAFALPAFAASGVSVFGLYSAASAAVKTSDAIDVRNYPIKTLHVSGATITSSLAAPTFGNMSGTAIIQGAPTATGPWSTEVANDYAQTAISMTASGNMTWQSATPYIRFKWTAGTTGKKLKAWLYYLNSK